MKQNCSFSDDKFFFFQQAQRTDKAQLTQQGEKNVCLLYTISISLIDSSACRNEMLYLLHSH